MKTLSYFVEAAAELDFALNLITEKIPCFANWMPLEDDSDFVNVIITCREEDAAFVEKLLAPFV